MPRERSRRSTRKSQKAEKPSQPVQNDPDGDHSEVNSNDPLEKDEVEEELERLVFGDEDGFKRGLQLQARDGLEDASGEDEEQEPEIPDGNDRSDEGLEGVDDADVSGSVICNDGRRLIAL
jgi:U3 small nucleolar RNA-associated protein 18